MVDPAIPAGARSGARPGAPVGVPAGASAGAQDNEPPETRSGSGDDASGRARIKKAPNAFRTISEVADDLHIPQHVLRFWETKFPQVRPMKRGG